MLRKGSIPVIARIIKGDVYFDMRTVAEEELPLISDAVKTIDGAAEDDAGRKAK